MRRDAIGDTGQEVGLTAPAMHVSAVVQHHPSRADLLPRLLPHLDGFDSVQVVEDPGGPEANGSWRTHRACLAAMPADATHALCIQDDALPQDDFYANCMTALADYPENIVCLFVPGFPRERRRMEMAKAAGQRYIQFRASAYLPLVATVYPAEVARGLLGWSANPRLRGADDSIAARYCRFRRLMPVATVPCLVDHDDTVDRVGQREQHRRVRYAGTPRRRNQQHRRAALL